MKKVLFGSSALALVGAVSAANAAEFEVKVGGYFEAYAAFASSDRKNAAAGDDVDGIDSKLDSEIHFKPTITLDNGLRIGADIQLEGAGGTGTGDTIDEQFLFIKGSFGEVLLGSENSAGYKMTYAAPDVTFINVNSGSITGFVPYSGGGRGNDTFRGTLGSTYIENGRNNDANRFTYFSPRFAGFQLGVSYARDAGQDTNAQLNLNGAAFRDIFDFGANYVNTFGDFSVAASARFGMATDDRAAVVGTDIGENPTVLAFGLNLGYAGFTVGGSWAEQNNAGNLDGTSFDVGVSYETGPWGVSVTYFHGENVDNEALVGQVGNDETLDQFLLGVSYKLAKGVTLGAFGAYIDFDEETSSLGPVAGGDDVDGFIIGTGIKISF